MAEKQELRQDMQTLRDDVTKLRSDLSGITQRLLEAGKDEAGMARYKLEAEVRKLLEEVSQTLGQTRERSRKAVEGVEQKIGERPLISLIIAFIVGLLLGKLFDRKQQ